MPAQQRGSPDIGSAGHRSVPAPWRSALAGSGSCHAGIRTPAGARSRDSFSQRPPPARPRLHTGRCGTGPSHSRNRPAGRIRIPDSPYVVVHRRSAPFRSSPVCHRARRRGNSFPCAGRPPLRVLSLRRKTLLPPLPVRSRRDGRSPGGTGRIRPGVSRAHRLSGRKTTKRPRHRRPFQ